MQKRLVVVSNRLPVAIFGDKISGYQVQPGAGGLVTALEPIIRHTGGAWIGWPGCNSDVPYKPVLSDYSRKINFDMIPVALSEVEISRDYRSFSNKSISPSIVNERKVFGESARFSFINPRRSFARDSSPSSSLKIPSVPLIPSSQ